MNRARDWAHKIVTKPARALPTPRVRQPLPIAPPTSADTPDTEVPGADQSPPMELLLTHQRELRRLSSQGGVTEAAADVSAVGHPVPEGAIDLIDDAPVVTSSHAHVSSDVSQVSGVTAGPDDTTQPGSRGSNLSTRFQTLLSRWNRTWQAR
ncbi:hypothetical protein THAOC_15739 [Thalassiosira oceanica]|uniref:Uncharacterized protein n=1 Tax=Thalassiosira oceanica TaxID=159749 RepID=K0SRE5_THAOC|nr:hypothetical protein THAOC_15739 [Thalassiosira oceanica]|eukprot:EJK63591.1 hypothetical protein THAOC_15739 [Thalassiosira oceanica]